ncbi:hypothetical protein OFC49_33635, partial [Escherichia coli]|nr:hypothetical protein [Escherichia coli]
MQEDTRRTQAATTGGGGTGQASAPGDALREAGHELRSKTAEAGARAGESASRLRDEAAGAA